MKICKSIECNNKVIGHTTKKYCCTQCKRSENNRQCKIKYWQHIARQKKGLKKCGLGEDFFKKKPININCNSKKTFKGKKLNYNFDKWITNESKTS